MKRLARGALLAELTEQLREQGSWCGETHLQKAAYFLQEALRVPMDFEFILYKHGPFSFELRDELVALRADGIFELESRGYPYGPSLRVTANGDAVRTRFPKTRNRYAPQIAWVAEQLGANNVNSLERLATAQYVLKRYPELLPTEAAEKVVEFKPHVSFEEAAEAVDRVREMSSHAPLAETIG